MQLKEILLNLKVTPTHFNILIATDFILAAIAFIAVFALDEDNGLKQPVAATFTIVSFVVGIGVLVYTENAKTSAVKEAKITRSGDKIHAEPNSEFMKSADLDVVAEKDGYIYVEFDNKTYRIEDLSKKGK